jgi:hypothetical protein
MNRLPTELIDLILEFQGYHVFRSGKYMRQLEPSRYEPIKSRPRANYVYRSWGYEVNFIKKIIPNIMYEEIYRMVYGQASVGAGGRAQTSVEGSAPTGAEGSAQTSVQASAGALTGAEGSAQAEDADKKKSLDIAIQRLYDMYEMGMYVKFTIKPMVHAHHVTWTMNSYYLEPKSYSHNGQIYWEETARATDVMILK